MIAGLVKYEHVSGCECSSAGQSATVACNDNAQVGGSRDTYNGSVDRSFNKTQVGDNAQIHRLGGCSSK